jgi:hypothetical protein
VSRKINRLSPALVDKLFKEGRPGKHPDGLGLYFVVSGQRSASWMFRYRDKRYDRMTFR